MHRKPRKKAVKTHWLRLTEASNALDYLKRAQDFIRQVDDDDAAWKWVVTSLYGALYGFMICALRGTNSRNVVFPKTFGKKPNQKTVEHLISFNEALRRCQQTNPKLMWLTRCALTVTPDQMKSIQKLQDDFRHQFEHYQPKGWSIEIHGMPDLCLDALAVLRFLLIDTNVIWHLHLTQAERSRLMSHLHQCPRLLKKTRMYRELASIKAGKARFYDRPTRSKRQQAFNAVFADFEKQEAEKVSAAAPPSNPS